MASSRSRSGRIGAVLGAILRLTLLVGLGFGLGLAIGLVAEEPGLVYGYFMGEGESVALAEAEGGAPPIVEAPLALANQPGGGPAESGARARRSDPADRAAPRPEPRSARELPDVAARGPALAPTPPRPAESTPDSTERPAIRRVAAAAAVPPANDERRFAVQVGAFSDESAARRLVDSLESKRYPAAMLPSTGSDRRWRVRVQPLRGEDNAREVANRLKREEGLPTWVVPLETGAR